MILVINFISLNIINWLVIVTERICDVCEADTEFLVNFSVKRVYYLQHHIYALVFKLVTTIPLTIFGPKRDDVTGEWRKLHNEELYDLYPSPNIVRLIISKRIRWAGHAAGFGARERGVYRVLVGKSEGKRIFGRLRRRWEDNIKMDLQEMGCGAWTGSSWLRIGRVGGHLWMRWWTLGFHKMRAISRVALNRLASQEGLHSMK